MEDNMDVRNMKELAREVLAVQDACNLSGVVLLWGRSIIRLRKLLSDTETSDINRHPINRLWADKVAHLSGIQNNVLMIYKAYDQVEVLARENKE